MDAVELIEQDHRRIETLLGKLFDPESETTQEDLYMKIQSALLTHAEMEERVFFPALERFASHLVVDAIQAQAKVKVILMELLDADADEQTLEDRFKQLIKDVRLHIVRQESPQGILELARQQLDADTLVEMAERMIRIQRGQPENLAA